MDRKAVIFDFDGTLADSFELMADVFYEMSGVPPVTDPERIKKLRQLPLVGVGKELGVQARQVPGLVIRGRKLMAERISTVEVFAGVPEMLRTLHTSGHRLFIMSSNSEHNVKTFLAVHNLEGYFEAVYGGAGLFAKTRALKKALRRSKLKPEQCVYVGDEARDVVAAHKAGVPVIAVAWGYNEAKWLESQKPLALAETPAQLLKILEK